MNFDFCKKESVVVPRMTKHFPIDSYLSFQHVSAAMACHFLVIMRDPTVQLSMGQLFRLGSNRLGVDMVETAKYTQKWQFTQRTVLSLAETAIPSQATNKTASNNRLEFCSSPNRTYCALVRFSGSWCQLINPRSSCEYQLFRRPSCETLQSISRNSC